MDQADLHVEGDALQLHLVEVLQQVFRGLVLAQHFRPHPDAHPPGCNVLPAKKGGACGRALLDESGGQKSEGRATNLGQQSLGKFKQTLLQGFALLRQLGQLPITFKRL